MKYFFERLFFKYYQFYSGIESDDFMKYYYSAFALSLIFAFYLLALLGILYKTCGIKLFILNGASMSILFFSIVIIGVVFFYKNRVNLMRSIESMDNQFEKRDIIVWVFTLVGFISLFVGGIWLI